MKKFLLGLVVVLALSLPVGGYLGYKHFAENYVLISYEDVAQLEQMIQAYAAQAYEAGKAACRKAT